MLDDVKVYESIVYETLSQISQRAALRQNLINAGVSEVEIDAAEKRAQARADTDAAALEAFHTWAKSGQSFERIPFVSC